LFSPEAILGLPRYQITGIEEAAGRVRISARHTGRVACPHCKSQRLRLKDKRMREPRHESWGLRHCILQLESAKFRCKDCGRTFWQRFPGILPRKRATVSRQAYGFRNFNNYRMRVRIMCS
jgi:transposase